MRRSRVALLAALGVDNFGSGLFLPVVLLYVTRVVGLPLAAAGTVVALGTVAGLAVPPTAGRLVDRVGPRRVVIGAELIQALGAVTYLVARGTAMVAVAAVLLAAGQQLFYSSLFALIADVAGAGPRDRPFAVAAMVRSACFGLGALMGRRPAQLGGSGRLPGGRDRGRGEFRGVRAAPGACGPGSAACSPARAGCGGRARGPWSDRPFLALIVVTGLVALPLDFYLSGMSVYVLRELHAGPWLPGAALALYTGLNSAGGTAALWATRRLSRTTAMARGAALLVAWCGISVAAVAMPARWRAADLLAGTVVLAAAGLAFGVRVNALAEATSPAAARGRYLAAFQYSFTVPGVLAPAVVALFSVAVWLPWLLVGAAAGLAVLALRWLASQLPATALRPGSVRPDDEAGLPAAAA